MSIRSLRLSPHSFRKAGFTLIELLVVIAIIGLLASIILASLNTARQKGRDAKRVSDIKEIQLALELYYDALGQYPVSLGALVPTYISAMPTDPSSTVVCTTGAQSGCYDYAPLEGAAPTNATCDAYHLGTSLEVFDGTSLDADYDGVPNSTAGTYAEADSSGGIYDGPVCSGAINNASGADFGTGSDMAKCQSSDLGNYCYDVEP